MTTDREKCHLCVRPHRIETASASCLIDQTRKRKKMYTKCIYLAAVPVPVHQNWGRKGFCTEIEREIEREVA